MNEGGGKYYVYAHRYKTGPNAGDIFYIGKGTGRRAYSNSSRNVHWQNVNNKYGMVVDIVSKNMNELCALTLEKILISVVGIGNLANKSSGGEGGNTGVQRTEEAKRKTSESLLRYYSDAENRNKLSASFLGREFDDDVRGKISSSVRSVWKNDSYRRKTSLSIKASLNKPDTLRKLSEANSGINNPMSDKCTYTFSNKESGESFNGTRSDFCRKYGIKSSSLSLVMVGKRKQVYGWSVK